MRRRTVIVITLWVAIGAFVFFAGSWLLSDPMNAYGCAEVPLGVETKPYGGPYGVVTSCRRLGGRATIFGKSDGHVDLLIETTTGPVALRVVYSNLDLDRQYVAAATEISPGDAGLGSTDAHRLQAAIDARGGLWSGTWTLHYGDG